MKPSPAPSRRDFLSKSAIALPFILPANIWAASKNGNGPNSRIEVGLIGMGKRMRGLTNSLAGFKDVQITSVCDVVDDRVQSGQSEVTAAYAKHERSVELSPYSDFCELIDSDGVDAVVISTPDHWHAIQSVLAAKAGKHVYCEKPLTRTIAEGRAVVQAAQDNGIIYQTGSQQRTEYDGKFRTAVECVRNGRIGELKRVYIGVGGPAVPCDLAEEELPPGINWDQWLGPAPMRGFNEILCPIGVHHHFPRWRDYLEYAGGPLSDIGAHHFDIAQWAMGRDGSGPVRIKPPKDRAATSGLTLQYDDGIEMIHGSLDGRKGCHFVGTEGTLFVDRKEISSDPDSILTTPLSDNDWRLPVIGENHQRNWIDCIHSGDRPVADAEVGHRTNTICQLANIGYWLGRDLEWNPKTEQFTDAEANAWLHHEDREPWNGIIPPLS